MSEDKNLNGVMDSEEVELDEMTEALVATGEADGNSTSEEVSEEVESLTVTLTFGDEVELLEVTENFQLDLRKVCNEQGSRFDEFEVEGDLSPQNLRLLMNALK